MSKVALIAGATGLVGSELLKLLLENTQYAQVISLQRNPATIIHPKLITVQTDFSNLQDISIPNITDAFCCLGTTIKKAGSKKQFEKIDLDLPLAIANRLIQAGLQHYVVISSMGANATSFFFYNQVKGRLEMKLAELIEIAKITIVRPSLLIGERKEKRIGEAIGIRIASRIKKIIGVQIGIESSDVAKAMVQIAEERTSFGIQIYESNALKKLASK